MSTDLGILLLLAGLTYATRAIGVTIAPIISGNSMTAQMLTALSGCVLAALIAPPLMLGDTALRVGVVIALLCYLVLHNALLAIMTAVLACAALRAFL